MGVKVRDIQIAHDAYMRLEGWSHISSLQALKVDTLEEWVGFDCRHCFHAVSRPKPRLWTLVQESLDQILSIVADPYAACRSKVYIGRLALVGSFLENSAVVVMVRVAWGRKDNGLMENLMICALSPSVGKRRGTDKHLVEQHS